MTELGEARGFTPGLIRALSKQKVKEPCDGCGFPMPVYPGRYPATCPACGGERPAMTDQRESKEKRRAKRAAAD